MRKTLVTIAVVCFASQSWAQTMGDIVYSYLPIADKDGKEIVAKLPLPPGEWHVLQTTVRRSSGDNTRVMLRDVVLDRFVDGRLQMSVFATLKINDAPITWTDDFCKDFPRMLSKNDFGTAFYRQKCVTVWMNTFRQSQSENAKSARAYLDSRGVKYDANQVGLQYARHGDVGRFLIYEISLFPSVYGLDNPLVTNVAESPYFPVNIQKSPEKVAFTKAVMTYAEQVAPLLDDFYFGKETPSLPEFKPN